ncbi:MAG: heparinase II/III family protein [Clostridia bacterium]|nr:heparinase II/III family protein [Clostridia bacterium]
MGQLFPQFNEQKWEQVRTHPYFKKHIAQIKERAEAFLATDPPRMKFSDMHLFVTTGDRSVSGKVYNEYNARLEVFFFMYLLEKDEKWIEPLADIMWNICDFESWSIPAHVKESATPADRHINLDLCSTLTGFSLAEILYFIGDKLPDLVYRRVHHEIRVRIIDSYKRHNVFWEKITNNWSAVCISAVLGCYLYLDCKEELEEQLPFMLETMNCYLRGFENDGCCTEGYGYWNYGFSHFCIFADMLRSYTDGKIDLFKEEKAHAVALFQQNVAVNEKECISFSDGPLHFSPNPWLSHFLKHEYPDMEIPHFEESNQTSAALRYVLWQDPDMESTGFHPASYIYPDSQWFIFRGEKYTLVAKGGYNQESHNHNDIGSFILSCDGKVSFVDPGSGAYTRQYFDGATRYQHLVTSSTGHSVPIINGQIQVTGMKKSKVLASAENYFKFTLDNGYDIPTLDSLVRTFDCQDDVLILTDSYVFSEEPESIVERFVSFHQPQVTPEGIICGTSRLVFDSDVFSVSLKEGIIESQPEKTLYQIDLQVKEPKKETTVSVSFYSAN